MRHRIAGRKFDRNTGARKALLRNLVGQLFKHDRIVTTTAKAKEVRSIAEKLITKAKREDLHCRRQILKVVTDKTSVKRLFDIILAKLSDRNSGGYTRIIKLGNRKGDDAPMALLEIIEPGTKHPKSRKLSKKKASGKEKSKGGKGKITAGGKAFSPKRPDTAGGTFAKAEKEGAGALSGAETEPAAEDIEVEEKKEKAADQLTSTKDETQAPESEIQNDKKRGEEN